MKNGRQAVNAKTDRICYIPYYIIFANGTIPAVCNDFRDALDKSRYISGFVNEDEDVRIFYTLTGEYVVTYKNGKIIK